MENLIVSDTGALITLEKMNDGFEFIKKLYKNIIIPPTVLEELTIHYQSPEEYFQKYDISDFMQINNSPLTTLEGSEHLQQGEIEAIALAKLLNLPLLIEDNEGKQFAKNHNIHVSGIAGRVLRAFELKVIERDEAISKIKELFDKYRLNKIMYQKIIDTL